MMSRCITGREACQATLPMTTLLLILVVAEAIKSNGFSQVLKQEHCKRAADDSITEVPVLGRSLWPGLSAARREDESYLVQTQPSAGQSFSAKEPPKHSGAHLVQEAVQLMGDRKLSQSLRVALPRQANIDDEPGVLGGPVRQAEIENSPGIVGGPARQGDIENAPGMFGGPARQAEIEGAPGMVGGSPRQAEIETAPGVIGGPARQAEMEDAPGMVGDPPRQGEIEDGPRMLGGPISLSSHKTLPEGKSGAAVGLVTSDRSQSVSSGVHPGRTVLQEQGRTAGCRIYVLDLADIAVEMGVHICNIEDVVADHITQVVAVVTPIHSCQEIPGSVQVVYVVTPVHPCQDFSLFPCPTRPPLSGLSGSVHVVPVVTPIHPCQEISGSVQEFRHSHPASLARSFRKRSRMTAGLASSLRAKGFQKGPGRCRGVALLQKGSQRAPAGVAGSHFCKRISSKSRTATPAGAFWEPFHRPVSQSCSCERVSNTGSRAVLLVPFLRKVPLLHKCFQKVPASVAGSRSREKGFTAFKQVPASVAGPLPAKLCRSKGVRHGLSCIFRQRGALVSVRGPAEQPSPRPRARSGKHHIRPW
eukprot:jgi/Botrbrau1/8604/Bobra.0196s0004.1